MTQGRLKREPNPEPGEVAGFTPQHDTTGEGDFKDTSPKNPFPVKDKKLADKIDKLTNATKENKPADLVGELEKLTDATKNNKPSDVQKIEAEELAEKLKELIDTTKENKPAEEFALSNIPSDYPDEAVKKELESMKETQSKMRETQSEMIEALKNTNEGLQKTNDFLKDVIEDGAVNNRLTGSKVEYEKIANSETVKPNSSKTFEFEIKDEDYSYIGFSSTEKKWTIKTSNIFYGGEDGASTAIYPRRSSNQDVAPSSNAPLISLFMGVNNREVNSYAEAKESSFLSDEEKHKLRFNNNSDNDTTATIYLIRKWT